MTICTGACWSPARLLEEGMITPDEATCPLCGHQGADEGHLFWKCPKVMEAKHPAIQKSNRFCAEYSRIKEYIKCRTLYWRGLVSEGETTPMGHIFDTADLLKPILECQESKITVFTDGSVGKRTKDKRLRRCGWAWVAPVPGSNEEVQYGARGALWGITNSPEGGIACNPSLSEQPQRAPTYERAHYIFRLQHGG